MTVIWCMVPEIWSATDRTFCHFGPFFALFPPNNPKNQNFEKMKKTPGDIIILNRWNINNNHMMYISGDMECDGQNFFVILGLFYPFTPLNTKKKSKFWKNEKKAWRYYHVTQVCHKWQSYDVWLLRYGVWWTEFFVILDHFLHFYLLHP